MEAETPKRERTLKVGKIADESRILEFRRKLYDTPKLGQIM
jgi:hypothetical protein